MRSFHHKCLKEEELDDEDEDKWYCPDCVKQTHPCFICGEYDDPEPVAVKPPPGGAGARARARAGARAGAAPTPTPKKSGASAAVGAPFAGTIKCTVKTCGKYYHHQCLVTYGRWVSSSF